MMHAAAVRLRPDRQRQRAVPRVRGGGAGRAGGADDVSRRLFNLAAAMSLVLCVAAAVSWPRSYLPAGPRRILPLGSGAGSAFPAVPLFAGRARSAFVGAAPGRVLLIFQSSWGGLDASNCGVL